MAPKLPPGVKRTLTEVFEDFEKTKPLVKQQMAARTAGGRMTAAELEALGDMIDNEQSAAMKYVTPETPGVLRKISNAADAGWNWAKEIPLLGYVPKTAEVTLSLGNFANHGRNLVDWAGSKYGKNWIYKNPEVKDFMLTPGNPAVKGLQSAPGSTIDLSRPAIDAVDPMWTKVAKGGAERGGLTKTGMLITGAGMGANAWLYGPTAVSLGDRLFGADKASADPDPVVKNSVTQDVGYEKFMKNPSFLGRPHVDDYTEKLWHDKNKNPDFYAITYGTGDKPGMDPKFVGELIKKSLKSGGNAAEIMDQVVNHLHSLGWDEKRIKDIQKNGTMVGFLRANDKGDDEYPSIVPYTDERGQPGYQLRFVPRKRENKPPQNQKQQGSMPPVL